MKRMLSAGVALALMLYTLPNTATAELTTIGTAMYGGGAYNLIWDDNNNGNSVVWLDFTNNYPAAGQWAPQSAWASGLNSSLTYNIDPSFTVNWGGSSWRLPTTVDGPLTFSYDGSTSFGYNNTSSEVGHLYYEELGNLAEYDTNGNSQGGWGLINTGDFNNLIETNYWSSTASTFGPYADYWVFSMRDGIQGSNSPTSYNFAMALRNAQVEVNQVPEPSTVVLWSLFAALGFAVTWRRRKSA